MGPVPFLDPSGLTDATGTLGPAKEKRIHKAREAFHQHFPQCQLYVVIKTFRDDVPLELALFWIFNLAGLSPAEKKAGKNHDLLLVVDSQRMLTGLTMGYGLEAFINSQDIDRNLACAAPQLAAGDLTAGIVTIIEGLSELFATTCRRLPVAAGLPSARSSTPALATADY